MATLLTSVVALTNLWALPAIYKAEMSKRRNSSVFLFILMFYGCAHALSSTEFATLYAGDSAARYMRIDYILVLLFIFFSDEFQAINKVNLSLISLMVLCFIFSDAVHLLDLTAQWYRLVHCVAQCSWRFIFYKVVYQLQECTYK